MALLAILSAITVNYLGLVQAGKAWFFLHDRHAAEVVLPRGRIGARSDVPRHASSL